MKSSGTDYGAAQHASSTLSNDDRFGARHKFVSLVSRRIFHATLFITKQKLSASRAHKFIDISRII